MDIISYIGWGIGAIILIPLALLALLLSIFWMPALVIILFRLLKCLLIIMAITASIVIILQLIG